MVKQPIYLVEDDVGRLCLWPQIIAQMNADKKRGELQFVDGWPGFPSKVDLSVENFLDNSLRRKANVAQVAYLEFIRKPKNILDALNTDNASFVLDLDIGVTNERDADALWSAFISSVSEEKTKQEYEEVHTEVRKAFAVFPHMSFSATILALCLILKRDVLVASPFSPVTGIDSLDEKYGHLLYHPPFFQIQPAYPDQQMASATAGVAKDKILDWMVSCRCSIRTLVDKAIELYGKPWKGIIKTNPHDKVHWTHDQIDDQFGQYKGEYLNLASEWLQYEKLKKDPVAAKCLLRTEKNPKSPFVGWPPTGGRYRSDYPLPIDVCTSVLARLGLKDIVKIDKDCPCIKPPVVPSLPFFVALARFVSTFGPEGLPNTVCLSCLGEVQGESAPAPKSWRLRVVLSENRLQDGRIIPCGPWDCKKKYESKKKDGRLYGTSGYIEDMRCLRSLDMGAREGRSTWQRVFSGECFADADKGHQSPLQLTFTEEYTIDFNWTA